MESLDTFKTDTLMLLIGTNPLPNLVAARLLAASEACVYLLHSTAGEEGESNTEEQAKNLESLLGLLRTDLHIQRLPLASSDNEKIRTEVEAILKQRKGRVGLNYTSGTKPMAVHAYRAIESVLRRADPLPVFSYLDPRQLALRIDYHKPGEPIIFQLLRDASLRQLVEIDLEQLGKLHGYTLTKSRRNPLESPNLPDWRNLLVAVACVYAQETSRTKWRQWLAGNPTSTANLPAGSTIRKAGDRLAQFLAKENSANHAWIWNSLKQEHWLEEYALECFRQVGLRLPLAALGSSLEYDEQNPKPGSRADSFELDVAAMYGYQLFGVSCFVSQQEKEKKSHLFEVVVRVRQLGGDEARAALVCCADDPRHLEEDIARKWDARDKFRVFGQDHLPNLKQELENWITYAR